MITCSRTHKRSSSYSSVFVRWDEIRPKCGLFGDKESKSGTFDHFHHTPYKPTAHIE